MRGGGCRAVRKVESGSVTGKPGVDYAVRVISGEARGPLAGVLRVGLSALSLLYRGILVLWLFPYRLGIRKRRRLPCRVISVGNITFGGTGKTPTVRTIAAEMVARGLRPVILSRGHGGGSNSRAAVVSDGNKRLMQAAECGDEPAMLADLLPGVPVVIGKNRWESGQIAIQRFKPDIILLDDGLQYWQLDRQADVVLVNAVEPFGYGHVMPRGALREPASGLRRASVVLITNSDKVSSAQLDDVRNRIAGIAPGKLIVEASHCPVGLRTLAGESLGLDWLSGRPVSTVCSIGTPGLFRDSVAALGANVVRDFSFPDHHLWRSEEIGAIAGEAADAGAEALVTTEKDAVKLPAGELKLPILAVDIKVEFRHRDLVGALLDMVNDVEPKL